MIQFFFFQKNQTDIKYNNIFDKDMDEGCYSYLEKLERRL